MSGTAITSADARLTGCRQQPLSARVETASRRRVEGAEEFVSLNSRFLLTNEFRS